MNGNVDGLSSNFPHYFGDNKENIPPDFEVKTVAEAIVKKWGGEAEFSTKTGISPEELVSIIQISTDIFQEAGTKHQMVALEDGRACVIDIGTSKNSSLELKIHSIFKGAIIGKGAFSSVLELPSVDEEGRTQVVKIPNPSKQDDVKDDEFASGDSSFSGDTLKKEALFLKDPLQHKCDNYLYAHNDTR